MGKGIDCKKCAVLCFFRWLKVPNYDLKERRQMSLATVSKGAALAATTALGIGLLLGPGADSANAGVYGCPTSTVCLFTGNWFTGERQDISGYSQYANVNSAQHDNTTSWINANRWATMGIGEWRNGSRFIAQKLPPGWYESDLRYGVKPSFNNMADFIVMV